MRCTTSWPERRVARIGLYEIRREIGRGGMGRVFLAHDPRLARDVALKILKGSVEERELEGFRREASVLGPGRRGDARGDPSRRASAADGVESVGSCAARLDRRTLPSPGRTSRWGASTAMPEAGRRDAEWCGRQVGGRIVCGASRVSSPVENDSKNGAV